MKTSYPLRHLDSSTCCMYTREQQSSVQEVQPSAFKGPREHLTQLLWLPFPGPPQKLSISSIEEGTVTKSSSREVCFLTPKHSVEHLELTWRMRVSCNPKKGLVFYLTWGSRNVGKSRVASTSFPPLFVCFHHLLQWMRSPLFDIPPRSHSYRRMQDTAQKLPRPPFPEL